MKLYRIARIGDTGWDEYDSFVVRAADEEAARRPLPLETEYDPKPPYPDLGTWTNPALSTCVEITEDGPEEIICASFNAG